MATVTTVMDSGNFTSLPSAEPVQEKNYFLAAMYIIVGLLIMVSNGVVLFVIIRTKSLQKPTLWVISHMAFWDFVMGFFNIVILFPSALLHRFAYPEACMGVIACLVTYFISVLFFNVATIVIDRLICLRFPVAYSKMRKRTYLFAAIFVHVLAVCRTLLVSFPDMDFYYNEVAAAPLSDYGNVVEGLLSMGFLAVALVTIIVCSFLIIHTVKRRRRRIGQVGTHVISRNNIKLSTMTVLSSAVFCVSFIPLVTAISWSVAVGYREIPTWVIQVMILCIVSNSIWNVLIYAATYHPFRESLVYIFCRSYSRAVLRRRHGVRSSIERVDATVSHSSKTENFSVESLVNIPGTSSQLQMPNGRFLASGAKQIPKTK